MGCKIMVAVSLDPERKRSDGLRTKQAGRGLLIWEECYYGPPSCLDVQGGDMVHLLVDKMMIDSHVNIVGEGLVGRVAFTGNHQWILLENYYREAHPPQVLKEICQQCSAGMQTVSVIPVLPHGVLQFGSYLTITEDMGFVNDVVSLVLQLGHVPGVLLSNNYAANELPPKIEGPLYSTPGYSSLESNMINASSSISESYNYVGSSAQTSIFDNLTSYSFAPSQASSSSSSPLKTVKMDFSSSNRVMNKVAKAEVIPLNSRIWTNQHLPSGNSSTLAEIIPGFIENDRKQKFGDAFVQSQSGDDLFDILGADFKNKIFSNCSQNKWDTTTTTTTKNNNSPSSQENLGSGIFSLAGTDHLLEAVVSKVSPAKQSVSLDDNISCKTTLTNTSTSKVRPFAKQNLDDNISCKTTLTNMSSSSGPNVSLPYGRFGVSDEMKGELLGISKYLAKAGASSSKENSRTYSQGSSIYDAWIEKGNNVKHDNSVSIGYSKKPQETSKANRKRAKPGENPRPRPKDRQMIQDRVKELREIVPNGAKCSIDALLERTIKHMLFMQSVTKHADKLKQNPKSKTISKDDGLLLKDNFEGGATWAYEVGSQSMMLCEERGLFLEIADIIRGLGLTILKGVMETRNDKIWARFAVEANRDVTRMEIFISLVGLLEQSSKSGVLQHNNICNDNLMVQQFHQAASVPTTGRICSERNYNFQRTENVNLTDVPAFSVSEIIDF
ncbi:hypothetical protein BUALT_Bualt13G0053700 [Buddleja alternifolia]|uniref:BHLH domain-containing protein n=1 Tax=Buddleja alternifolia TaxID=168488 RepID=A0AAV6WQD4_9LAMI|nr:hypothetical protein BUALT_Bualt13G0053700 [Buddleja alternifolia]